MLRTCALRLRRAVSSTSREEFFLCYVHNWNRARQNGGTGAMWSREIKQHLTTVTTDGNSGAEQPLAEEKIEKILTAVVLERLPVVMPQLAPSVSAFQSFSFEWQQQFRREYPQEFLDASSTRGDDEGEGAFEPGPTITDADQTDDRKSLQRALDRRLYLIIRGFPYGGVKDKPIWHFPEKEYDTEETLRKCAESAIEPFVNNLSDLYFVGNAPCGHITYRLSTPSFNRFFFKSQMLGGKVHVVGRKIRDYAWVSKEELPQYFDPSETEYLKKMLLD